MKRSVMATLVLSLGLVGGMAAGTATADAAKWHRGTPKVIRGNWSWQPTKRDPAHSITIDSKKLNFSQAFVRPVYIRHPKYKYVKHNYYLVYGWATGGNAPHYKAYQKWAFYRKGNRLAVRYVGIKGVEIYHLAKIR